MADQARPNGLVITDDSGNYYYLRPEVLAQAKMPDEDVKKLKQGISSASGKERELSLDEMHSVAGGVVSTAQIHSLPQIQTTGLKIGSPSGALMSSTIMCPW